MKKPIYLDYMATTPTDKRVVEAMLPYFQEDGMFGNPTSLQHAYGFEAAQAVGKARQQVADLLHADASEIVWTSGATESINLAIKGAARFHQHNGKHIITSLTEHRAGLDSCKALEKEGFDVTYLRPNSNGIIDLEELRQSIRPDTILVSVMHVNNEIGVIQDIETIGKLTRSLGCLFHVDAAQSAGKLPIDLQKLEVDLMSLSAHKVYGPKGIGALYLRRKPRVRIDALLHGGGHENGLRSGTLPTPQIVGMGKAFQIAKDEMAEESARILQMRQQLWQAISAIPGILLNGDEQARVPGNLNFSVEGVEGESLLLAAREIAVSNASACSSASLHPSYVLTAIGRSDALAHSSLRVSIGRNTRVEDISTAIQVIRTAIQHLRAIAP